MRMWLAPAAVLPLIVASTAHAQMKELAAAPPGAPAARAPYFRLVPQQPYPGAQFTTGTLVEQDLAPNAAFNVGMSEILGRKKRALTGNEDPVRSRKPAVSFVLKF
jgi:hypothetical protein